MEDVRTEDVRGRQVEASGWRCPGGLFHVKHSMLATSKLEHLHHEALDITR